MLSENASDDQVMDTLIDHMKQNFPYYEKLNWGPTDYEGKGINYS